MTDNLGFLISDSDFWIFVTGLCWFFGFYLAIEGRHLAYRRSLNQRVWLGAAIFCGVKVAFKLQELLFFSFPNLQSPALNWPVYGSIILTAIAVLAFTFLKVETSPRNRRRLIVAMLALVALDAVFTLVATRAWSLAGHVFSLCPLPEVIIGIAGQVVIAVGFLAFIAWQTQRMRIHPQASRMLAEGIMLFAILAVTYVTCQWLYRDALAAKNDKDITLVRNAALAVPPIKAEELVRQPANDQSTAFVEVLGHLRSILENNFAIETISLWTIRGDEKIVLAGISRHDGDMAPGKSLGIASAADRELFASRNPSVEGAVSDVWGVYTRLNDRVFELGSDRTICWLHIDLNAQACMTIFTTRRLLVLSTAALLCLLVVVSNNYRLRTLDDIMVERGKQQAAEGERVRLGRDLHDELGQILSAINIQSNLLSGELQPESAASERCRKLCDLTQHALVTTQEIARGLVPEDGDFSETFREFCRKVARSLSVECSVDYRIEEIQLRREARVAILRVAQESINNAVKHGSATRIDAQLQVDGQALKLRITDNGTGFQRWERQVGIGTSVMRARIEELGGSFSLESTRGSGVVVACSIPMNEQRSQSGML